jgi:3-deoxy-D-manno-octulosonic acid (KDO) 8-phosphate synthase
MDNNTSWRLVVVESNVEMADDILLAVQEHFREAHPHPDVKYCDCANRLRAARMLLRQALEYARRGS